MRRTRTTGSSGVAWEGGASGARGPRSAAIRARVYFGAAAGHLDQRCPGQRGPGCPAIAAIAPKKRPDPRPLHVRGAAFRDGAALAVTPVVNPRTHLLRASFLVATFAALALGC